MVEVRHKVWATPESRKRFKKPKCDCKSWIEHWGHNRKPSATRRCVHKCGKKVWCGAHVSKTTSDNAHYIVPYCKANWGKGSAIENVPENMLVPVTASSCKNKSKKTQKKNRKTTRYCRSPKSEGSKRCWRHKGKQTSKDGSKCGYPLK